MQIKNKRHLTKEQEELVQEMFNFMRKFAEKTKDEYYSPVCDMTERAQVIEHITTKIATLGEFINNELQYEVRTDDGMLLTQEIYNKAFGYEALIKRDIKKLSVKEE